MPVSEDNINDTLIRRAYESFASQASHIESERIATNILSTNILSTPRTQASSVFNIQVGDNSSWQPIMSAEIDGAHISADGVSFKDIIADVKALQAEVKALKAEIKILQLRLPVPESARKFIRRV